MKQLKGFILGFMVCLLLSSTVLAAPKLLQLIVGETNILYGGNTTKQSVLTYQKDTYISLNQIATIMDKELVLSKDKKTIEIKTPEYEKGTIIKNISGDKLIVKLADGKEENVRLLGINSSDDPTTDKLALLNSSKYLSTLAKKTVYLEKDKTNKDKHGNILRYIWFAKPITKPTVANMSTQCLNAIIINKGYSKNCLPITDVKYNDIFNKLVKKQNTKLNVDTNNVEQKNYIGSSKSNKYHTLNCRYSKKIKVENKVYFSSIKEAESEGYSSCKVCKPQ